jgi:hypothetical protein
MLSEKTAKQIATLLGLKEDDFLSALKADAETDVTLPAGTFLSDTQLTEVKNREYANGKDKGVEMAVKAYKDEAGLEFTGKTIDGLVKAAQAKAIQDANIPVDDRVKDLNSQLENLRKNYTKLEGESTGKDSRVAAAENELAIYRSVPSLGDGYMGVDMTITLMKSKGYDFVNENGEIVVKKGGATVVDNLSKVIPVKDVMQTFQKENGLFKEVTPPAAPGRSGRDTPGGKVAYTKMSELKAAWEAEGKNINGLEFSNQVRELKKENKDFDMKN